MVSVGSISKPTLLNLSDTPANTSLVWKTIGGRAGTIGAATEHSCSRAHDGVPWLDVLLPCMRESFPLSLNEVPRVRHPLAPVPPHSLRADGTNASGKKVSEQVGVAADGLFFVVAHG